MLLQKFPNKEQFHALAQGKNVVPVCVEVLADTETPVSLLKKFYDDKKKGQLFLFESVEGGERWGRYSFLGTSARCHVRVFKTNIEIRTDTDTESIPHSSNPLPVLRQIMARYQPAEVPGLPRFWGGLVGYLTYEMVSFFEKIPNTWPDDMPLAHFIIPDEVIIFDNIRNALIAVAITFLTDGHQTEQLNSAFETANTRLREMLAKMAQPLVNDSESCNGQHYALTPKIASETFRSHVRKVKDYVYAGDIIQAVISQPFLCNQTPDLWSLYRAQRYINPSPYLFFMHLDNVALVGSSPETMVRLENNVATLRPIAGTRPRGKNEQEDRALADDMLKDEKERAEHLMLVDLGRNDLGRVAQTGTVQVTDLMIVERYSHVMHLVSNITCDLDDGYDAWDLLAATFPAGTLSGAPKIRAMEIIAELEDTPRGPYGGAVGYVSFSGNMDMAITIRTACIEDDRLTVRAGAGIVADSDPERERIETVNKSMAIQRALQLLNRDNETSS